MNKIDEVRNETLKFINLTDDKSVKYDIIESPCKKYKLYVPEYYVSNDNQRLDALIARIRYNNSDEEIAVLVVNESFFYHSWVSKNEIDYLLCAEDLCGGQTIVDLTNKKLFSYSENNDGFIWTKHLLSPDKNKLAVFGCGWGSEFFIKIYSFENPYLLPLILIEEPNWWGYDILEWIDNNKIKVLNNDKEEVIIKLQNC